MSAASVLRIFRFRPVHPEFDQVLRAEMIPDLQRLPGLVDVYVGRRGPEDLGERIVASVWADRDSMEAGLGASLAGSVFHPDRLADTTARRLEVHDLAIAHRFDRPPASVLRLFRGRVRPGELDLYIDDADAGTLADDAAGRGPCALYLAPVQPDRFITMSLWPDWASVEVATGGDIEHPIMTRDPSRIIEMDAVHYEVVPDAT